MTNSGAVAPKSWMVRCSLTLCDFSRSNKHGNQVTDSLTQNPIDWISYFLNFPDTILNFFSTILNFSGTKFNYFVNNFDFFLTVN